MQSDEPRVWPQIPETEAQGEIAELYADIRAVTTIPLINLIYRSIAAVPGALRAVWTLLRPFYDSGLAGSLGRAMIAELLLPELPQIPSACLKVAGLTAANVQEIADVLDSYAIGNAMNLLGMSVLLQALNCEPREPAAPRPTQRDKPLDPGPRLIPPLLPMEALSEDTRELVSRLDCLGEGSVADRVAPSLFRHLAHWPMFLCLAAVHLLPADADGSLAAAARSTQAHAVRSAKTLALALPTDAVSGLHFASLEQVRTVASQFVGVTIPRLLPMCLLLRRSLPGPP